MTILDAKIRDALAIGRSFSLGDLIYRSIWALVWNLFASWTPRPFHFWRRLLLRIFGAKIESGCSIYPSACIWDPRKLEMATYSCIGPRVICYSMAKISLGRFSVASQGAHLCAGTHDITDPNFQLVAFPIIIGERAWIAADAFVGPGVTVGDGAVLGARAVTFSDLPPWTVSIGNPAYVIKSRIIE